jgi:hypothetical protein
MAREIHLGRQICSHIFLVAEWIIGVRDRMSCIIRWNVEVEVVGTRMEGKIGWGPHAIMSGIW